MIPLMFVHYTLSSVWVAEWPPLRNSCSLDWPYVLIVFWSNYYHFGFMSEMWLLIDPVPVYCFSSTCIIHSL